jgi:hypothetical protein
MLRCAILAVVSVAALATDQTYWWKYAGMDAESEDIKQLPCAASCTLDELETACSADANCVAFNTHGWLKNSLRDMAADSCDLYVKKDTPQPSPPPPPPISFWPMPINTSFGGSPLQVSPSLTFSIPGGSNPDLQAYAARTAALMFQHSSSAPSGAALSTVIINVQNPATPLTLGVDESYTLFIPADGTAAIINAATNYGAYWGLQTLAQAIQFNFDARAYLVAAAPLRISDAPKFAWRGILIDTDRHWQSLPVIYNIIDSLT